MSRSPEAQYHRHLRILRRRQKHLANKDRNSYDNAELSALDWVIEYISSSPEQVAHAIDSIDKLTLYKGEA